jgi:hypothetical protein
MWYEKRHKIDPSGRIISSTHEAHETELEPSTAQSPRSHSEFTRLKPLVASLALMALSAGLSSRFDVTTPRPTIIGLQILFSAGAGIGAFRFTIFGMDWSALLVTATLKRAKPDNEDTLAHASLAIFAEMLGSSMGIAAAQAVFISQLRKEIPEIGSDLSVIWGGGVTNFKEKLSGETLERALAIFNTAITRTFYLATGAGALPVALPIATIALLIALIITPPGATIVFWYWWARKRGTKSREATAAQTEMYPMSPMYPLSAMQQSYFKEEQPRPYPRAFDALPPWNIELAPHTLGPPPAV